MSGEKQRHIPQAQRRETNTADGTSLENSKFDLVDKINWLLQQGSYDILARTKSSTLLQQQVLAPNPLIEVNKIRNHLPNGIRRQVTCITPQIAINHVTIVAITQGDVDHT